jgi:hypothetical protein
LFLFRFLSFLFFSSFFFYFFFLFCLFLPSNADLASEDCKRFISSHSPASLFLIVHYSSTGNMIGISKETIGQSHRCDVDRNVTRGPRIRMVYTIIVGKEKFRSLGENSEGPE